MTSLAYKMETDAPARPVRDRCLGGWAALIIVAIVVAISVVWGWRVQADDRVKLGAAPLVGEWRFRFGWSLVLAVLFAAAVVWRGAAVVGRMRFGPMAVAAGFASAFFTLLLAASDGLGHVLDPVVHPTEYWANVATLPPAHEMLQKYGSTDFLLDYSVHAKGHPPGFLLLLKALDAIGLGHPWVVGALSYLGAAVVVVAVLLTVRLVASEDSARSVAPFLVIAPYAVWMGTSADAFYTAVTAWGVLALVAGMRSRTSRRRSSLVATGGVVLATSLFLTYGAAMFLILPAVVAIGLVWSGRRTERIGGAWVLPGLLGAVAVVVAWRLGGFWWFDGAHATQKLYWWGTAQFRPARYFAVANIGTAAIAIGPAVVFGVGRLRDRRVWLLVGGALACIVAANASQYSKAEVERIWLLFFPWLVPAVASLRRVRPWLAVQAALAIGLQFALVSKW
jgi:methylthioxylose transferase